MTKRPIHKNGYSKKQLIEIIEKIDADQDKLKRQNEKPNTNSEDKYSNFSCEQGSTI